MATLLLEQLLIPLVGWTLSIAAARALGVDVDWLGVAACILGVFAAYRLDHVLDRSDGVFSTAARRDLAAIAAASGLLLGIALVKPTLFVPLAALGALGLFYVPLKRFVPKNLLTASAWAVCVVMLSLDLSPFGEAHWMATAMIFFLVLGNATLCDLPDIERDRQNQVMALVAALGHRRGGRIGALAAGIALVFALALGAASFAVPATLYIAIGLFGAQAVASHPKQRWLLDAVLVLPGPISFFA